MRWLACRVACRTACLRPVAPLHVHPPLMWCATPPPTPTPSPASPTTTHPPTLPPPCRCPPGHGDIYPSLLGSGMLDRLIAGVFRRAAWLRCYRAAWLCCWTVHACCASDCRQAAAPHVCQCNSSPCPPPSFKTDGITYLFVSYRSPNVSPPPFTPPIPCPCFQYRRHHLPLCQQQRQPGGHSGHRPAGLLCPRRPRLSDGGKTTERRKVGQLSGRQWLAGVCLVGGWVVGGWRGTEIVRWIRIVLRR